MRQRKREAANEYYEFVKWSQACAGYYEAPTIAIDSSPRGSNLQHDSTRNVCSAFSICVWRFRSRNQRRLHPTPYARNLCPNRRLYLGGYSSRVSARYGERSYRPL